MDRGASLKIGILPLAAGRKAGGPETYEVELVRSLAALDRRNEYFVYCTSPAVAQAIGVEQENFIYRRLWPANRWIALSTMLPVQLLRDGVNLLHCTYAPPPISSVPYVFTLHCTSNLAHPEFYGKSKAFRLNTLQRMGLKRARYVMCVSQFIRNYITGEYHIPDDRTGVVYNGVGRDFKHLPASETKQILSERFGIDYPFILYVGKLQARKNIIRLIQAYAQYRRARKTDVRLVLAGARTETSEGIDEAIAENDLQQSVVQLGYVAPPTEKGSPELPALYGACRMFVLPSLYEGFGIPLLEAMACGAPVVTSDTTCLPEVAGGAALTVNPLSVESIAEAMFVVDNDPEARERLIQRGLRRAAEFSWDRCARETLGFYERGLAK